MFHCSFIIPLFVNSRGYSPPFTILPKRDKYLLSRRIFQGYSQYQWLVRNIGITEFSGYDPPWHYKVYSKKGMGRSAESHYPTMKLEDIKALPVAGLADRDCALFLWVTLPCLLEGIEVLKAWGFEYKTTAFVWVKQNRKSDSLFWGMGFWTRSNAEICLLGTKGRPKRKDAGIHQVVISHVEEHSRKPQEVHDRIIRLMGDVPRIELFARRKTEGFDVWGNEVESDIKLN